MKNLLLNALISISSSRSLRMLQSEGAVFLSGSTQHARYSPIKHAFKYPVVYAAIDLLSTKPMPRWFSHKVRTSSMLPSAVVSLIEDDYLGGGGDNLKSTFLLDRVMKHLHGNNAAPADLKQVWMVTMPRWFGYAFNPITVYYCYGDDEKLNALVVEVNNTFDETHVYVLHASMMLDKVRSG